MSFEELIEDAHYYQESIMNTNIAIYELKKIPPEELEYNENSIPVCKADSSSLTLINQIGSLISEKKYEEINPAIIQKVGTPKLPDGRRSFENYVLILFVRPYNKFKCNTCRHDPVIFNHYKGLLEKN